MITKYRTIVVNLKNSPRIQGHIKKYEDHNADINHMNIKYEDHNAVLCCAFLCSVVLSLYENVHLCITLYQNVVVFGWPEQKCVACAVLCCNMVCVCYILHCPLL